MDALRFSILCKVRQCSQCQGETEFYCNTCKHELCLQCKEGHVIDLDTIYHDVVIYREIYENIPKQETCERHPERIYKRYCHSCELPVCFQCKKHRKHKIQDIRTTYKASRQQHREIVQNIRSETLYNSCFLLADIKTDIKICHTETSNHQSEMSTKAERLKNFIDTVIWDVKIRYKEYIMHVRTQHKRKMSRRLAKSENYEYGFEQSANRPVKFLLFLKKTSPPKILDISYLTQPALLSPLEEINMEDMIKLLSEIQMLERGKRQLRNECLLKLMSTPAFIRSVRVTGVKNVIHISSATSDRVWICDYENNLILTNTEGEKLRDLKFVNMYCYGVHTVNITCDLIYIDRNDNINKLSKDNTTESTLIKKTGLWIPQCIFCSPSNGDLLVGFWNRKTSKGKVRRYNDRGNHIQTIKHTHIGQELYSTPRYITENRNGDVTVSDSDRVVVTDRGGRHRFSYTGPPSKPELDPCGICTDVLSHILVCDRNTDTVQMIDKDGNFLSLIRTQRQGLYRPYSLLYDEKTHLLWVGSGFNNKVSVYRYIQRQDYRTEGVGQRGTHGEGSQNTQEEDNQENAWYE